MNITKKDFDKYEAVRESGVTNMFAFSTVSKLSGLSRDKVLAIMEDYGTLRKKYYGDEQ